MFSDNLISGENVKKKKHIIYNNMMTREKNKNKNKNKKGGNNEFEKIMKKILEKSRKRDEEYIEYVMNLTKDLSLQDINKYYHY